MCIPVSHIPIPCESYSYSRWGCAFLVRMNHNAINILTGNGDVPHWECISSPGMHIVYTGSSLFLEKAFNLSRQQPFPFKKCHLMSRGCDFWLPALSLAKCFSTQWLSLPRGFLTPSSCIPRLLRVCLGSMIFDEIDSWIARKNHVGNVLDSTWVRIVEV